MFPLRLQLPAQPLEPGAPPRAVPVDEDAAAVALPVLPLALVPRLATPNFAEFSKFDKI